MDLQHATTVTSVFIVEMNNKTCLDNYVSDFMLPLASCSHCSILAPATFVVLFVTQAAGIFTLRVDKKK